MKKCSKCNKVYDDSWGLCLVCSSGLVDISNEEAGLQKQPTEADRLKKLGVDPSKLRSARTRLKRDFIISIVFLFCLFGSLTMLSLSHAPAIITGVLFLIYCLIVHYRMFRTAIEMKEGALACYATWIIGWMMAIIMLMNSKEMLNVLESKNNLSKASTGIG